jgi:Xaa-Pro aminopeptidase
MKINMNAPNTTSAKRLQALWAELEIRNFDGFLIPRADEYQGEYVPPCAQRLAWLTGFTGSAGLAIVHRHESAIFVDGRYILAVRDQVDQSLFKPYNSKDCPPDKWLCQQPAAKLAYDPWLHTPDDLASLQAACEKVGGELIACEFNFIDRIWLDQPDPPLAAVVPHPLRYAGETSQAKREQVAKALSENRIDAAVLTAPDSIAWLLNIRGGDVPYAPLPHCKAIIYADGQVDLFMDARKQGPELLEHLGEAVTSHAPDQLGTVFDKLAQKSVRIDPSQSAIWIFKRLEAAGAKVVKGADPCALPKACKNKVEIAGARAAHRRDGIALTRFLHWLEAATVDEIQAAERLAQFRAETGQLCDLSFETISAAGANGAIVHYQVTPQSNKMLEAGNLYLFDSGGQYLEGTTDVTRTVAIGTPTFEHKQRFTQVLKGHIRLATCRFPEGTTGSQLDVLARLALWQVGLDFDHGTGHGVGSYLSVHEGPQRISKIPNNVALKPGMIISNEPGYYKEGAYGIRIENLLTVTEAQTIEGGELPMMGFEVLTLAPIDLNLVEPTLLSEDEIAWLNGYHKRVFEEIGPALEARGWLAQATRAI